MSLRVLVAVLILNALSSCTKLTVGPGVYCSPDEPCQQAAFPVCDAADGGTAGICVPQGG